METVERKAFVALARKMAAAWLEFAASLEAAGTSMTDSASEADAISSADRDQKTGRLTGGAVLAILDKIHDRTHVAKATLWEALGISKSTTHLWRKNPGRVVNTRVQAKLQELLAKYWGE